MHNFWLFLIFLRFGALCHTCQICFGFLFPIVQVNFLALIEITLRALHDRQKCLVRERLGQGVVDVFFAGISFLELLYGVLDDLSHLLWHLLAQSLDQFLVDLLLRDLGLRNSLRLVDHRFFFKCVFHLVHSGAQRLHNFVKLLLIFLSFSFVAFLHFVLDLINRIFDLLFVSIVPHSPIFRL